MHVLSRLHSLLVRHTASLVSPWRPHVYMVGSVTSLLGDDHHRHGSSSIGQPLATTWQPTWQLWCALGTCPCVRNAAAVAPVTISEPRHVGHASTAAQLVSPWRPFASCNNAFVILITLRSRNYVVVLYRRSVRFAQHCHKMVCMCCQGWEDAVKEWSHAKGPTPSIGGVRKHPACSQLPRSSNKEPG